MRPFYYLLLLSCSIQAQNQWVNPFVGTGGHGHTYPGATAPYGMVQLSPDTRLEGWDGCSGYHYSDSAIYGFSHTHLSGTGVSDYGDILLMPMIDLNWESEDVKQAFDHANENASPGFYSVELSNEILVELTASPRVGVHRYTFPKGSSPYVLIDLLHRDRVLDASIEMLDDKNIKGHRRSSAWAVDQNVFFHIRLSQSMKELIDDPENPDWRKALRFKKLKKPLIIWVGLSSTSTDGALLNLEAEADEKSFDDILEETAKSWTAELSKIEVEGSYEQKHIFYSALYHTMIVPNLFSDIDGHYRGMDGEVHRADGDHYTVFSLWDTYRAAHPLYTLIDHKRTADYLHTFDRMYSETERLPVWELAANETNCMIGYHAASVIADALVKGLSPLSPERTLEMVKGSSIYPDFGMSAYRQKGYLDVQDEHESVSKTLEYGYDDFCVATIAERAGSQSDAEHYQRSSLAYRNIMNDDGFMQARDEGTWLKGFEPREVNNHFTEANSWQYSFYVPHDLAGFMERLGGAQALENQLDQLFSASQLTTGRDQADITGLIGQYAHGNEPSHHIAYLYNTAGIPHKTQEKVKQILDELYHNAPDGLSGNEDCGQMSAWYILSSMGFYPVCPGDARYVIGYPLFEKVRLTMGNGKILNISKKGEGDYIQSVSLNGRDWPYNYLFHHDLMAGGSLEFEMGIEPSSWGSESEFRYHTEVKAAYLSAPVLEYESPVFFDSTSIRWTNPDDLSIYFRSNEGQWKELDADHLKVDESGQLDFAFFEEGQIGAISSVKLHRRRNHYNAKWINTPNVQYQAGGPDALVDEVFGDEEWRKGRWVGIQGESFIAEVDLGEVQVINALGLSCLQDVGSWIVFPKKVAFFGKREVEDQWTFLGDYAVGDRSEEEESLTEVFRIPLNDSYRYIQVQAEQFGPLPNWHPGAASPSFIFVDEIKIIR